MVGKIEKLDNAAFHCENCVKQANRTKIQVFPFFSKRIGENPLSFPPNLFFWKRTFPPGGKESISAGESQVSGLTDRFLPHGGRGRYALGPTVQHGVPASVSLSVLGLHLPRGRHCKHRTAVTTRPSYPIPSLD